MYKNEFVNRLKSPFNILWLFILPIGWFLGTKIIRTNIDFLEKSIQACAKDPRLQTEVADRFAEQLNAQNGFMVFMEGCSDFYVPVFIALLSGIVFSTSFLYDKNSGFGNFVITRVSFKKYFISKTASVFIVPFGIIFIVLTLIFFASLFFYSAQPPTEAFNFSMLTDTEAKALFFSHYWLSCFIMIFTLSLFGGLYALLGMGISAFTSNRFLISVSPLAIYIFCTLIPQLFNLQSQAAKYLAWIFPSHLTGIFISNTFWYTSFSLGRTYCVHFLVLLVPVFILLLLLYYKNKTQYIR